MSAPTPRWTRLKWHDVQQDYWNSQARFNVVPAGRRSGKTELAKRRAAKRALSWHKTNDGNFIYAAPTRQQAKDIYWEDAKLLIPDDALYTPKKKYRSINESAMSIKLWNQATLRVVGLDKPERAEGKPIDFIVLDEYGNMKKSVWDEHIRPALSTIDRLGCADMIGVPEGRNHYYDVAQLAMQMMRDESATWEDSWAYFHWKSSEILSESEISAAKRELDLLTFQQEYDGSFVNFTGRVYYAFNREDHAKTRVYYDPTLDLHLCFDFNVDPGIAVAVQEKNGVSLVINEVYIPKNSNTLRVCEKLISLYGSHTGNVWCYGDATGGARGSAKVQGSDWDLVKASFRPVFGTERLKFRVPSCNPAERSRVNSMNSRMKPIGGEPKLFVDPVNCPKMIRDLEGVPLLEGGSGQIDKASDKSLTHLSDALGYYVYKRFPVVGGMTILSTL